MFITYLELYHFKPMLHKNLQRLELHVHQPLQIVIGDNGTGKSSLLAELIPGAAMKPRFEDDGRKVLHITHQNDSYVLISDFTNRHHVHSFFKNGTDLNISGIAPVQDELAKEHFQLDAFTINLIKFGYALSEMGKTDRKSLLMRAYPTNLSFIEHDHQRIAAKVRGFKSQLKLLTERQMQIKDELLEPSQYQELKELTESCQTAIEQLDRIDYAARQQLEFHRHQAVYIQDWENTLFTTGNNRVLDQLHHETVETVKSFCRHRRNHRTTPVFSITPERILQTESAIEELQSRQRRLLQDGKQLQEELTTYRNQMTIDYVNEQATLVKTIEYNQQRLTELQINPHLPIIDYDEIPAAERYREWLQTKLEEIQVKELEVISYDQLDQLNHNRFVLDDKVTLLLDHEQKLQDRFNRLQTKKDHYRNYVYPKECRMQCALKQSVQEQFHALTEEQQKLEQELEENQRQRKEAETTLEALKERCLSAHTGARLGEEIIDKSSRFLWVNSLLTDGSWIKTLNEGNSLLLRLETAICNSRNHHEKVVCTKDLDLAKMRYTMLKDVTLPARDVLLKVIADKDGLLHRIETQCAGISEQLTEHQQWLTGAVSWQPQRQYIEQLITRLKVAKERLNVDYQTQGYQTQLDEIAKIRRQIQTRAQDLSTTLRAQDKLLTRLHDEIEPSIKAIEVKLLSHGYVEQSLSPTVGLPHRYLVKFLSVMINNVNSYINQVWDEPMELVPPKEDEPIDYAFPVLFNRNTLVKDISSCSTSERQMINMAWTLVLRKLHQFHTKYPLMLDEPDSGFSVGNQSRLLDLFNQLFQDQDIGQMFLISHHAGMYTGFAQSEIACLLGKNIVLPPEYNQHVVIER